MQEQADLALAVRKCLENPSRENVSDRKFRSSCASTQSHQSLCCVIFFLMSRDSEGSDQTAKMLFSMLQALQNQATEISLSRQKEKSRRHGQRRHGPYCTDAHAGPDLRYSHMNPR